MNDIERIDSRLHWIEDKLKEQDTRFELDRMQLADALKSHKEAIEGWAKNHAELRRFVLERNELIMQALEILRKAVIKNQRSKPVTKVRRGEK